MVGLLVLFIGIGVGIYYQNSAKNSIGPDSMWYPVQSAWEWTRLNVLTWSDSGRLQLRLEFMQEKLNELITLATSNKLTKEYAQKIENEYTALANAEKDALAQKTKDTTDAATQALLEKLNGVISQQQKSLDEILQKAPDLAGGPLESAFSVLQTAYQKAMDAVQGK